MPGEASLFVTVSQALNPSIYTKEKIMTKEAATTIAPAAQTTEAPDPMRILQVATCPSLSGRSELTYHIGCDEDSEIQFRIWANTAAGMFSNMWVAMAELNELLAGADKVTSGTLQPLFASTSKNNAGFMLAVLKGEGLIDRSQLHERAYQCMDSTPFLDRINALIAAGVDLPEDAQAGQTPSVAVAIAVAPKRVKSKKS